MNLVSRGSQTPSVFNYIFKGNVGNVFCYLIVLRGANSLPVTVVGRDSAAMGCAASTHLFPCTSPAASPSEHEAGEQPAASAPMRAA